MENAVEIIAEEIVSMPDQVLEIVDEELISLISLGVCGGFMIGSLFALAAYGVFKAISLLSIKNISK